MSGILHLNGLTYFPVPKNIFTLGRCPEIKGSPLTLLMYILYLSQERTKASVYITNDELLRVAGMTKNTVRSARAILEEAGFVNFTKSSNGYTYHLLNPENGKVLCSSIKGEYEPLDFNSLSPDQLRLYYTHHLKGPVTDSENGIMACCPFHDDSSPSMSIDLQNGSRWYCHPCNTGGRLVDFEMQIAIANGKTLSTDQAWKAIRKVLVSTGAIDGTLGQPEAVYPYKDAQGELLFEVLRYPGKQFKQRRPDPDKPGYYVWNTNNTSKVLYGLPAVVEAEVVAICEGEKDCDNLRALHISDENYQPIAITTCPGGASKWDSSYSQSLKGKRVLVFPDQDAAGLRHARSIELALKGLASEVKICNFPEGFKDMTEYLGEHDLTDLASLIGEGWISVPVPI